MFMAPTSTVVFVFVVTTVVVDVNRQRVEAVT
jgi:hypothetical protein